MLLRLPRNGQKQGVLVLVSGGLDFDIPKSESVSEMLECECQECGELIEVPAESWLNGDVASQYKTCQHFERQGCYKLTGSKDESTVYATCTCGEVDTFDFEREWKGGAVKAIGSCVHGEIGAVKGCLRIERLYDTQNWLCRCVRCGDTIKVSRLMWALGSYDGTHECAYWGEKQGCYTLTGRQYNDNQVEARCTCGTVDYFTRDSEWESGAVARNYRECPHGVLKERQGVYQITDIHGADKYRAECVKCRYTIYPTHEEWRRGVYAGSVCEH